MEETTTVENQSQSETPEVSTGSILQEVVEGAVAHAAATEAFVSNFDFYGKSLGDWAQELAMITPPNPNTDQLKRLFAELSKKLQQATDLYARANSISSAIVGGGNLKKSDLIAALVERYANANAKRPAASVLERMAESYMNSTVSSRIAAQIVKDFFKNKKEGLEQVRRCLESIAMLQMSELKHLDRSPE